MSANYLPYARVTTGNPQTTLDAAAKNPVGALWAPPTPYNGATFSTTATDSTAGLGAPPVFKYVYFYDSADLSESMQAAPAPVYYIDESFSTVTANAADAYFTTGGACVAGYLMPNTTALGTSNTATQWYTQLLQSYCWIQVGGFLPGALQPSTRTGAGAGSYITGLATGEWASLVNTTVAASSRILGIQWTAISSAGLCDVLVGGYTSFFGS